jgi:hypothetical protein
MKDVGIFFSRLSVLRPFNIFCGNLVHFMVIGIHIFPVSVYCTKKNLATLLPIRVIAK